MPTSGSSIYQEPAFRTTRTSRSVGTAGRRCRPRELIRPDLQRGPIPVVSTPVSTRRRSSCAATIVRKSTSVPLDLETRLRSAAIGGGRPCRGRLAPRAVEVLEGSLGRPGRIGRLGGRGTRPRRSATTMRATIAAPSSSTYLGRPVFPMPAPSWSRSAYPWSLSQTRPRKDAPVARPLQAMPPGSVRSPIVLARRSG